MIIRRGGVVLVAAVLALVSGCTGGGDDSGSSGGSASNSSNSSDSPSSSSSEASGSNDAATSTAQQPLVQQQTLPVTGKLQGEVVVAVTAAQVRGKLATVGMTFTPTLPQESSDTTFSLYNLSGSNSVEMTLVDPVNLKRYAVVKDSNSKELAPNEASLSARNGGSASGTYVFAAPPQDVKALDVYMGEYPPFTNVPVKR